MSPDAAPRQAITAIDRARLTLAACEVALAMHRDTGDRLALRAAQARVNGLRSRAAALANRERALAEKLVWLGAAR